MLTDEQIAYGRLPRDDDSRSFSDSLLPDYMIEAGEDALEGVDTDLQNYVPGETTDWDYGMTAVAVYRAMTKAFLARAALQPKETDDGGE